MPRFAVIESKITPLLAYASKNSTGTNTDWLEMGKENMPPTLKGPVAGFQFRFCLNEENL